MSEARAEPAPGAGPRRQPADGEGTRRPGRLDGKTAIVTGATSGIGTAISALFAAEGARVVLCGRERGAALGLRAGLGAERTAVVLGDITDPETAEAAVAAAATLGPLDILVNNAAMDFTSDLHETSVQDVRQVFEVNVIGAFLMLRAAARQMRGRGGSIINISSRTASVGVPTMAVYGASKGALASLTRGAAVDLAADAIRVNAVAPGLTETPLTAAWLAGLPDPDAARSQAAAQIPQGRFGSPADVAAAVLYLASDESAHVTGITLAVDGGYTAA